MLLVRSAIERLLNLLTYSSTALFEKKELRHRLEEEPQASLGDTPVASATAEGLQERL
jgi:hypothetical protein